MSPDDATQAWSALLSRLESDLARARGGLELSPWRVPEGMPPLPESLAPRARALLDEQAEVTRAIAAARSELTRAVTRNRRVSRSATTRPVYLDSLG